MSAHEEHKSNGCSHSHNHSPYDQGHTHDDHDDHGDGHGHHHHHHSGPEAFSAILKMILFFIVAFVVSIVSSKLGFVLYTAITLYGLIPAFKKMVQDFKSGYIFSIELLMSVAAVGAIFINAAQEAASVIILFMIGEALESYTTSKARSSVASLSTLIPDETTLLQDDGSVRKIKVEEVQPGHKLEIKVGERFPVDGTVLEGSSAADESLLTGESMPVLKEVGHQVIAGSINTNGRLIVQATHTGKDNSLARLIALVESAQSSRARIMRSIEKFSRYYTPAVFVLGVLVALVPPLLHMGSWYTWIYRGLSLLLIGCPCALMISTPSAIAAGITAASRLGILIKNATALETIGKITRMAFDKTGTLTEGKVRVTDVVSFSQQYSETDILNFAAALEKSSNHPLAQAVEKHARAQMINLDAYKVTNLAERAGAGLTGTLNGKKYSVFSFKAAASLSQSQRERIQSYQEQGKTISVVLENEEPIGFIGFQDSLKKDAAPAIDQLKHMGIECVVLTGDHTLSANPLARTLNISVRAELLPAEKLSLIRAATSKGPVAMVGDGINDAPALAAASVGIAMGSGTNAALDSAQIVIAKNNVSALVDAVLIAKRTLSNIRQNVTISLGLKILFLFLILRGDTRLWVAILADTGATVLVTLNAMRLLRKVTPFHA